LRKRPKNGTVRDIAKDVLANVGQKRNDFRVFESFNSKHRHRNFVKRRMAARVLDMGRKSPEN